MSLPPVPLRPRVAIIGAGIAGLGAAHALRRVADVQVFEAAEHVGGHSRTEVVDGGGAVDTGFMVYNEVTYPRLTALFAELGVATVPTDMSFSVQHRVDRLTFQGGGFQGVFADRRNLVRPRFWGMIRSISRFYRDAVAGLDDPDLEGVTLAEFARSRKYPREFMRWYLVPMAAAVWSSPAKAVEQFPAQTLLRFWFNHGFLGPETRHPWRTVVGGSREYVQRLVAAIGADRVHAGSPVRRVERGVAGAVVHFAEAAKRAPEAVDWVILATHAPQALRLLDQATALETEIVGAFRDQRNEISLHRDGGVLPRQTAARASWNYRIDPGANGGLQPSTHYLMDRLQPGNLGVERNLAGRSINWRNPVIVSVNGGAVVDPAKEILRFETGHPLFDVPAIRAQARIDEIHRAAARTRTLFAGAWQRYGFHEDGLVSGQRAAAALVNLAGLGETGVAGPQCRICCPL